MTRTPFQNAEHNTRRFGSPQADFASRPTPAHDCHRDSGTPSYFVRTYQLDLGLLELSIRLLKLSLQGKFACSPVEFCRVYLVRQALHLVLVRLDNFPTYLQNLSPMGPQGEDALKPSLHLSMELKVREDSRATSTSGTKQERKTKKTVPVVILLTTLVGTMSSVPSERKPAVRWVERNTPNMSFPSRFHQLPLQPVHRALEGEGDKGRAS